MKISATEETNTELFLFRLFIKFRLQEENNVTLQVFCITYRHGENGGKSCKYQTDTIMRYTAYRCLAKKLVSVDCLTLFTTKHKKEEEAGREKSFIL
jgi:hypothetical protein